MQSQNRSGQAQRLDEMGDIALTKLKATMLKLAKLDVQPSHEFVSPDLPKIINLELLNPDGAGKHAAPVTQKLLPGVEALMKAGTRNEPLSNPMGIAEVPSYMDTAALTTSLLLTTPVNLGEDVSRVFESSLPEDMASQTPRPISAFDSLALAGKLMSTDPETSAYLITRTTTPLNEKLREALTVDSSKGPVAEIRFESSEVKNLARAANNIARSMRKKESTD